MSAKTIALTIAYRVLFPAIVMAILLFALRGAGEGQLPDLPDECDTTNLDNDPQDAYEVFCALVSHPDGWISTVDADKDGDFDRLEYGQHGETAGWLNLDGDTLEMEIVVAAPNLPARFALLGDADQDGDPEVVWVGTMGTDFDKDGVRRRSENGYIASLMDLEGDGDMEILVQDPSRALGTFHAANVGIKRNGNLEVLWVGVAQEDFRGHAGAIVYVGDVDSDGDDEVIVQDIRKSSGGVAPSGETVFDVDRDGDWDIIIKSPQPERKAP